MKSAMAQLDFSVDVDCPYCGESQDIAKDDADHIVRNAIFNNNWQDLEGYEHICEFKGCGETFLIEKVEY